MDLYGQKSKSIPQKLIIHFFELVFLWLSYWMLFRGGGEWLEQHLHIQNAAGAENRRMIIFSFNVIIFLRIAYTTFFLIKRKMQWEETFSIAFAFALYYAGFSLFVLPSSQGLDGFDYFAILLFATGCVLNTGGEILRDRWKRDPENKGKIYTGGFFRYSRHINYFGDLLWLSAYALATKNWYAIIIPVLLFAFFAFYNAPELDKYLAAKYGKAYDDYAAGTKMLIPFVY